MWVCWAGWRWVWGPGSGGARGGAFTLALWDQGALRSTTGNGMAYVLGPAGLHCQNLSVFACPYPYQAVPSGSSSPSHPLPLSPLSAPVPPGNVTPQGRLFSGQGGVQVVLLLVALVAVPWMLLPKPLILKKRAEAAAKVRAHGAWGAWGREHKVGYA